jgi:hypothetical protein
MPRRLWFCALATAALLACGGDSGPSAPNVEGSWTGTVTGTTGSGTLTFSATETDGTVTGNGTLSASAGSLPLTVSGTFAAPTASLVLHAEGFEDVNLTGTVSESELTGTLNGSGFQNTAITLQRQ